MENHNTEFTKNHTAFVLSLNLSLIYINPEVLTRLAISSDCKIKKDNVFSEKIFTKESYNKLNKLILPKLIDSRGSWKGKLELCDVEDKVFIYNLTLTPYFNELNEVISIVCTFRNSRLKRKLEALQRLAVSVTESTIEGIMVTDGQAVIQRVNSAFVDITGYQSEEILGKTPKILRSNHHDDDFYKSMWKSVAEVDYWQGEIWNRRKDGSVYLQWLSINCVRDQEGNIDNYIAVIHDLSELRSKEEQAHHLANHDPLTGLGNRHQLKERLKYAVNTAVTKNKVIALLAIDLGRIQTINETFGYAWCDRLIKKQSQKLSRVVGNNKTLVRIGADEFALIIEDIHSIHDITQLMAEIIDILKKPASIDDKQVVLSPSIGVALCPIDGLTTEDLLVNAQTALNESKNSGRSSFQFFDQKMSDEARQKLELEQDLRFAIKSDGLSLHFQPQIQLCDRLIIGVEVLVRWHHPQLGAVSPEIFIPLAEECGFIIEIGEWVFEEACQALVRFRQSGLVVPKIAVNISVQQLEEARFSKWLENTLNHYGLEVNDFELEITETGLMKNELKVLDNLNTLHQKGFRIVLDDFGTGYSSLSYLTKLPLSTLKIDRSFIAVMADSDTSFNIVRTIVKLAHNLKFNLVAEGIEQESQAESLLLMGCNLAQGFLFHKPMPENEFMYLLTNEVINKADTTV